MKAAVIGAGAVGARAARQLLATDGLELLVVTDADSARAEAVAASLGAPAASAGSEKPGFGDLDVVVLALPRDHQRLAEAALEEDTHVVSVADAVSEVRDLLSLDSRAQDRGRGVFVGAGLSPGLSCVLARHAARDLDSVDEIEVAKAGAGGPACADEQRRALGGRVVDWRDGNWTSPRGRRASAPCLFPDPVGTRRCRRGALAEPLVLAPAFAGAASITARAAVGGPEQVVRRLPVLRRARPEGAVGAVRVEVRGRRGTTVERRVLGTVDRPAVAAGLVAGLVARWVAEGRLARPGAGGLATMVADPLAFLQELAQLGVRAAAYEGPS